MRINRICKICGDSFSAIKVTQFFCCRKCFKRDYYLRTKAHLQEEKHNPNFPIKKCAFCQESSRLNFDPMKNHKMYDAWGCPECGATNKLIWEYQTKPNSFQLLSQILVTFRATILQPQAQIYQPYKLPIHRPEMGNPHVVVMTCEPLDIVDIQKKGRKKIVFS